MYKEDLQPEEKNKSKYDGNLKPHGFEYNRKYKRYRRAYTGEKGKG